MTTRTFNHPSRSLAHYGGRLAGWLLVMGLLVGCAHQAPISPSVHARFNPQQIRALQSQGFAEQADGDWVFGMSDRMLFQHDVSVLLPDRLNALRHLAKILRSVGIQHLRVDGYTDTSGEGRYNVDLSLRRAQSVADALVAAGMAPADVTARGMGAINPVGDNHTVAGRAENRRAVLVVSSP